MIAEIFTSVYFCGFVALLLGLVALAYYFGTRHFGRWEKEFGIKGLKPVPFFGNEKEFLLGTRSLNDLVLDRYKAFEGHR